MKLLVTCVPQAGHLNPLLPVVSASIRAGDEVLIAAAPSVEEQVRRTGADFAAVGFSMEEWFGRLASRIRGNPGDGLPSERIPYYFTPRLFGEVAADDMIGDLLDVGRTFGPDWIVHDSFAFAGPLAADLLDVRSASHQIGTLLPTDVLQLVNDAVTPLWRSFDRDTPLLAGVYRDTTITICPDGFDPLAPPGGRVLPVQPTPLPQPAVEAGDDLIYVTLGTLWANPNVLRTVVEGFTSMQTPVLVTTGQLDPAELGPLPEHIAVERFVPQADVLPRATAVVHHGGAGTMFAALAHGLPQVVLPQAADNYVNAERLAASGTAIAMHPAETSVDAVRDAVQRVLTEPSYRDRAREMACRMAAMPTPAEVVDQLRAEY